MLHFPVLVGCTWHEKEGNKLKAFYSEEVSIKEAEAVFSGHDSEKLTAPNNKVDLLLKGFSDLKQDNQEKNRREGERSSSGSKRS